MLVYLLTNQVNGKYYVGKTVSFKLHKYLSNKRWHARQDATVGRNEPLIRAMRKYGVESFSEEILSIGRDKEHLSLLEKLWIILLDSRNPEVGYNILSGGENQYQPTCSEDTKRKISLANKGRKPKPYVRTEEHKRQTSLRFKGRKRKEGEHRGGRQKGYFVDEAGRESRRQGALKRWERRVSIS